MVELKESLLATSSNRLWRLGVIGLLFGAALPLERGAAQTVAEIAIPKAAVDSANAPCRFAVRPAHIANDHAAEDSITLRVSPDSLSSDSTASPSNLRLTNAFTTVKTLNKGAKKILYTTPYSATASPEYSVYNADTYLCTLHTNVRPLPSGDSLVAQLAARDSIRRDSLQKRASITGNSYVILSLIKSVAGEIPTDEFFDLRMKLGGGWGTDRDLAIRAKEFSLRRLAKVKIRSATHAWARVRLDSVEVDRRRNDAQAHHRDTLLLKQALAVDSQARILRDSADQLTLGLRRRQLAADSARADAVSHLADSLLRQRLQNRPATDTGKNARQPDTVGRRIDSLSRVADSLRLSAARRKAAAATDSVTRLSRAADSLAAYARALRSEIPESTYHNDSVIARALSYAADSLTNAAAAARDTGATRLENFWHRYFVVAAIDVALSTARDTTAKDSLSRRLTDATLGIDYTWTPPPEGPVPDRIGFIGPLFKVFNTRSYVGPAIGGLEMRGSRLEGSSISLSAMYRLYAQSRDSTVNGVTATGPLIRNRWYGYLEYYIRVPGVQFLDRLRVRGGLLLPFGTQESVTYRVVLSVPILDLTRF